MAAQLENLWFNCTWIQATTKEWQEETGCNFLTSSLNISLKRYCEILEAGEINGDCPEMYNIIRECLTPAALITFLLSNRSVFTFEEHRSGGIVVINKVP